MKLNQNSSIDALKQFLIESNKAGYAGGNQKQWKKESDSSLTITFEKGLWRSSDNFFGGEPYGGRNIVFYKNRPCWIMVYYGWVAKTEDANNVFSFLRGALSRMPDEHPFRGPEKHQNNEYIYTNAWNGDVARFTGEEQIHKDQVLIYEAQYNGGLVDQRRGL